MGPSFPFMGWVFCSKFCYHYCCLMALAFYSLFLSPFSLFSLAPFLLSHTNPHTVPSSTQTLTPEAPDPVLSTSTCSLFSKMTPSTNTPRPLRISSHNVQGMNSPTKRHKLFNLYHSQHIDIILAQEMHFPSSYRPLFVHHKFPQFYLANAPNKT